MRRKMLHAAVLLLLLIGINFSLASANGVIDVHWWVMGGGDGPLNAGGLHLESTIGQPVVGTGDAGGLTLRSGYWPGVPGFSTVRLPVIVKRG